VQFETFCEIGCETLQNADEEQQLMGSVIKVNSDFHRDDESFATFCKKEGNSIWSEKVKNDACGKCS